MAQQVKVMKHFDGRAPRQPQRELVPRPLAIAMFAMMAATVALVAWARLTDRPLSGVLVEAPVVQERAVLLQGPRSGPWVVSDAATGEELAASDRDRAGFLGVIGQSVLRNRQVEGTDPAAPLRIVRRENGHVAVIDDTTGQVIELIGYGEDNVAAVARLLQD